MDEARLCSDLFIFSKACREIPALGVTDRHRRPIMDSRGTTAGEGHRWTGGGHKRIGQTASSRAYNPWQK